MSFILRFAWRDLRAASRSLGVFVACLVLGVTLVAAAASLYRIVNDSLLADTRALVGGDAEIDAPAPLPADLLAWLQARGEVSLVRELDTILSGANGDFLRSELLVMDDRYPLYGELILDPPLTLAEATAEKEGVWGAAIDPVLAERLQLGVGDRVEVGFTTLEIRAQVLHQPDRQLNANWRGPPLLISEGGLDATQLVRPGSRIDFEYRIKVDGDVDTFREAFYQRFPDGTHELRTFADRSERVAERIDQVASALILIGFSTLFIGGLGVANAIRAYLDGKLGTLATLQAVGLRRGSLAQIYTLQVVLLGLVAGVVGGGLGCGLAALGSQGLGDEFGLRAPWSVFIAPFLLALLFSVLTAVVFALPALARALAVQPAGLFRGQLSTPEGVSRRWQGLTLAMVGLYILLLVVLLPSPLFGLGFVAFVGLLLALLELIVRGLRRGAVALDQRGDAAGDFGWHLALAHVYRPGSPLRMTLLSLGSALTLVVACTVLVAALLRAIQTTIPEESPALVLYEIFPDQVDAVQRMAADAEPGTRSEILPLVRARLSQVNGQPLAQLSGRDAETIREAQGDEYKLSILGDNPDSLTLIEGAWWQGPREVDQPPRMALEDREARELGIGVGDVVVFTAESRTLTAEVVALYTQKGLQTRFWFEGIVEDGALDPFIARHVGAVFQSDAAARATQSAPARELPNVISVRTTDILTTAGDLLAKASAGLGLIAGISLLASLLVLASLVSVSRRRQIYEATLLHVLGARHAAIRRALLLESLLLALLATGFATVLGAIIALPLATWRLKLPASDLLWLGALVALVIAVTALLAGLLHTWRRLRLQPATLLREG